MKLSEEGKNNKKTATIRKYCSLQLTAETMNRLNLMSSADAISISYSHI